jgi:type I restriction enzyme S subunit
MQVGKRQSSGTKNLPEGWVIQSVGSAGEVRAGKALAANGPGLLRPYLRTKNVFDGRIVTDDVLRMPMTDADFARYELRHGDVLLNEGQSIELVGRCAIYRNEYSEPCAIQNQLVRFRAFAQTCPVFAHYLFRRCQATGVFASIALKTTSVAHLGVSRFQRLNLAWPGTRGEQEAIAEALADADGWVESLEMLIAKKREIKIGIVQQLFSGKPRLPGFSGEWRQTTIGAVADVKTGPFGSALHERDYVDNGTPIITVEHLGELGVVNENLPRVSDQDRRRLSAYALRTNDIVFSRVGSVDRNSIISASEDGWLFSGRLLRLRVERPDVSPSFLSYFFHSHDFKSRVRAVAVGQTMACLNTRLLSGVVVSLPSTVDEQIAIAEVLTGIDDEIRLLGRKLDKARQVRQGMMQNLLTGRIRLLDSEPPQKASMKLESEGGRSHNWQINEAVVISVLAKMFGSEQYPLGRKRYTKLSYLLHRHEERKAEGYLKKAAGPYNPSTKYGGPEKIALENKYVRRHKRANYEGFVEAEAIGKAQEYFDKWYGADAAQWLEQFRFSRNDDLELWATVDMAMVELRASGREATVGAVKDILRSHPEWLPKLDRDLFADSGISDAIVKCDQWFGNDRGSPS